MWQNKQEKQVLLRFTCPIWTEWVNTMYTSYFMRVRLNSISGLHSGPNKYFIYIKQQLCKIAKL